MCASRISLTVQWTAILTSNRHQTNSWRRIYSPEIHHIHKTMEMHQNKAQIYHADHWIEDQKMPWWGIMDIMHQHVEDEIVSLALQFYKKNYHGEVRPRLSNRDYKMGQEVHMEPTHGPMTTFNNLFDKPKFGWYFPDFRGHVYKYHEMWGFFLNGPKTNISKISSTQQ